MYLGYQQSPHSEFPEELLHVVLHKTVIMLHLEYGCVVWDPHLLKDKRAIENVHRFALRVCSKQWRAS